MLGEKERATPPFPLKPLVLRFKKFSFSSPNLQMIDTFTKRCFSAAEMQTAAYCHAMSHLGRCLQELQRPTLVILVH